MYIIHVLYLEHILILIENESDFLLSVKEFYFCLVTLFFLKLYN